MQNQWHVTRSNLQSPQQKPSFGVLEHCTSELLSDLGVTVPYYSTRTQCRMTCRRRRNQRVVKKYQQEILSAGLWRCFPYMLIGGNRLRFKVTGKEYCKIKTFFIYFFSERIIKCQSQFHFLIGSLAVFSCSHLRWFCFLISKVFFFGYGEISIKCKRIKFVNMMFVWPCIILVQRCQ